MHKYLLLLLILTAGVAKSQNVFNSGDNVTAYNANAALGSASNPNVSTPGRMYKWVRTPNGNVGFTTVKYKPYLWEDANGAKMAFRLRYPDNYDSTKSYGLMLFLHGGGEIGPITDNELHLLWGAQTFQSMVDAGQWNGFILYPQETTVDWGVAELGFIPAMLDTLQKYNGFDPDRLITVGLSEGGLGDLVFSSTYPQRVATCIPSSPVGIFGGPTSTPFPNMIHIPIWMANGGTDTGPDPTHASFYADTVRALGGYCVQQFYPKGGHGIWTNHWGQLDLSNNSLLAQYLNSAHKAQPLLYFQNSLFCLGSPISARMGVTPGFYAYQWQLNGVDIPGATGNEYTATQAGSYRVHFKRLVTSNWSAWTPNPIQISTKPCSLDTAFAEHFTYNSPLPFDYQYNAPSAEYKRYNFNCMNGVFTTGLDQFTQDGAGTVGGRFSLNYTYGNAGCSYNTGDKIWGTYQNYPVTTPNTNYIFSFYAGNVTGTTPLAQLGARIDGTVLTQLSKPALNANLTGNNSWQKFSFLWNSGGNTGADLVILNSTTNSNGNDFVLDEIAFTRLLAPGGFGSNMMLWSKADVVPQPDSTRMNDWANSSGSTNMAQITPLNRPLLKNNANDNINFNPLVNFSASNAWSMVAPNGFAGTATHNAAHMFIVARTVDSASNASADSLLIERGNSSTNRVAVVLNMKNNVVWDAGSTTSSRLTLAGQRADLNQPILWTFSKDNTNGTGSGGGNIQDIRKNGVVVASTSTAGTAFTGSNRDFKMGLSNTKVAEVIYYLDANINAARQNRIESYLATKYGMTLGTAAAPVSYTASDSSTVFWPASTTYQHDVFGIGVDSLSGLNQLESNSINSGSGDGTGQAGKGNLILTAISPLGDKDFLMIGNDANVLTQHTMTAIEGPAATLGAIRVGREWKVKNTGNVGNVTLTFDTTGLTLAGGSTLANYILMIDSDGDGDFTTGTVSFFHATSAAGKQINFSGVTFNDGIDFTIITQASVALPETWLGFTAQNINGNGVLNWETSQEMNVSYYAVEHSTNGLDYTVIGVKTANNSLGINDYSYTQQSLSAGMHYYRIRAVDLDGAFKYSDVRSIKVSALNAIQIRPNPVSGSTLTLGISLQQSEKATIQIVSIDGKVMSRMNTQLTQGVNTVNLNVDAIPTGIYLVQVQMNDDAVTKKFIRTR